MRGQIQKRAKRSRWANSRCPKIWGLPRPWQRAEGRDPPGDGWEGVLELCSQMPTHMTGFPRGSAGQESACKAGDLASIPGVGRSPAEGKGCPLQYSGLENPMVQRLAKCRTRLNDFPVTYTHDGTHGSVDQHLLLQVLR